MQLHLKCVRMVILARQCGSKRSILTRRDKDRKILYVAVWAEGEAAEELETLLSPEPPEVTLVVGEEIPLESGGDHA